MKDTIHASPIKTLPNSTFGILAIKTYHPHFFHFPDEFDMNSVVDFTNSGHVSILSSYDLEEKKL